MFDNSFQRGQTFPFTLGQNQVIKGWDEGIALLNKGAKAFLFIPGALGYGEAGSPPVIPANAELVFYVELDDFTGQ
jgi:FKBP-type peptidyl-prolyl cis-trans isomerase